MERGGNYGQSNQQNQQYQQVYNNQYGYNQENYLGNPQKRIV